MEQIKCSGRDKTMVRGTVLTHKKFASFYPCHAVLFNPAFTLQSKDEQMTGIVPAPSPSYTMNQADSTLLQPEQTGRFNQVHFTQLFTNKLKTTYKIEVR